MAVVRELITKLGFDVDQNKLDKANDGVAKMGMNAGQLVGVLGSMAAAAAAAVAALAAVGAGLFAIVKGTANAGDEAFKMSQKIGVGVESFQRLSYAAKLADLSQEGLGTSLKFLSKNVVEAAGGSKEAAEGFKKLGIDPKKYLNDTEGLVIAISDQISKMPDGAEKTALSLKLMGRSGSEAIPFLNQGGAAIRELGKEAESFGLIISKDAAAQSEQFNDNLTRMGSMVTGLRNAIGSALLPVFSEMVDSMVAWYKANGAIIRGGLTKFFEKVGAFMRRIWEPLSRIGESIFKIFAGPTVGKLEGFASVLGIIASAIELWLKYLAWVYEWFEKFINSSFGQFLVDVIFGPIMAAFEAVFLLIDDLAAYFRGDDSVTGVMIDELKRVATEWLGDWGPVFDWLAEKFNWLVKRFEQIKSLNPFQWMRDIEQVQSYQNDVEAQRGHLLMTSLKQSMQKINAAAVASGAQAFSNVGPSSLAGMPAARAAVATSPGTGALPGSTPPAVQNKNMTVKSDIKVQIPAGSLAEEVARLIKLELDALLRFTANATSAAAR